MPISFDQMWGVYSPRGKYVRIQALPPDARISALSVSCLRRPNAIDVAPGLLIAQAVCCGMSQLSLVACELLFVWSQTTNSALGPEITFPWLSI